MLPRWQSALERCPLEDFGVQVFELAALHGLDEVVVVVATAAEFADQLAAGIERRAMVIAGHHHVAVGAVEDIADVGAAERLGLQPADLEHQGPVSTRR